MTAIGTTATQMGVATTMTVTFKLMLNAVLVEVASQRALNLHLASMTTLRAIAEVTAAPGMIQILELAVLTIRLTFQQVASAAHAVEASSRLLVVAQEEAAQGALHLALHLALVQMTTVQTTPVATTAPGMMSTHRDVVCMMTTTLLPLSNAAPVEAA